MTAEPLLRAQIEAVWGRGEVALVDRLYADTVIDHMPVPGQPAGREALKDVVRAFRTALPDLRMDLHGVLACGDRGVDFWTLTGTQSGPLFGLPPTGRRVRFSGIDMVRVADGRIAELWHVEEMLQFHDQLGQPPAAAPAAPVAALGETATWLPNAALLSRTEARNLALARVHLEEVWAQGRVELMPLVYAADVIDMNPAPGQRPAIAGIADALAALRDAAPDLAMRIDAYVPAGVLVADCWTMTGTHSGAPLLGLAASGRRFRIHGMDVARFRADGRIDRIWHVEEFAQLRAQIS